jgi:lipopolysaccharide biosynthesis regulator YciM
VLWITAFLLTSGAAAKAEFKLTVDLKDGAKIHDIQKIVAHADSSDGIDKVEFFVDDQLKATVTGIPYTLTWDTIADKEGKHTLAITAYDSNGQTKKITVSVEIDNELNLGAEALAKTAHEALAAGETAKAIAYSRRSLKADPGNVTASRVTAKLAARDADWTKAASVLEAANGYESDPDALHELATYRLRRALLPENASTFASSIQSYVELRQKAADMAVAKAKAAVTATDPASHEVIGDALLRAGHYKDAQLEYQKAGDNMPISTSNRLALAYTLQDNPELAFAFTRPQIQDKKADRVTRAIYGLALLHSQKFDEARAAVAEDLSSEYPAALIIAAYADVVNGKLRSAVSEAESAVKLETDSGDARYVDSMVIRNLSDSEEELVRAITLSPFASGPYIDYAIRIALEKQSNRADDAVKLIQGVLEREPDCISAKLTEVLLLLSKGNVKDAEPILDFQMRHTRAPDVMMIAAVYLTQVNKEGQAEVEWDRARKMDTSHFNFLVVPAAAQFLRTYDRVLHYRADSFLTFESLFPAPRAPKPETPAAPADAPAQ